MIEDSSATGSSPNPDPPVDNILSTLQRISEQLATIATALDRPPPAQPQTRLYTSEQVAEWLNVDLTTVRRWVAYKRIPFTRLKGGRLTRFTDEQLEQILTEGAHDMPPFDPHARDRARAARGRRRPGS